MQRDFERKWCVFEVEVEVMKIVVINDKNYDDVDDVDDDNDGDGDDNDNGDDNDDNDDYDDNNDDDNEQLHSEGPAHPLLPIACKDQSED